MRVAVVGAGVTGLAAGWELLQAGVEVDVYEASDRPGGKVLTTPFAGQPLDEAGDAFLARVPWATELCHELGLGEELVSPAAQQAYVWSRGALRQVPKPNVLGVPLDFEELAASGVVSSQGVARARRDSELAVQAVAGDESVGALIRRRMGDEVAQRLVDPLIGGINASGIDDLSVAAVAPQLAAAAGHPGGLAQGLAVLAEQSPPDPAAPVFFTLPEGLGLLVCLLADRLGDRLHVCAPVVSLDDLPADRIILTTPAPAAAALLARMSPHAAALLEGIDYASVVLVSLAYPAEQVEHPMAGSGFLVPAVEGRTITACSWASHKWAHVGDEDTVILRVSVGRAGDESAVTLSDADLLGAVRQDLQATMGLAVRPAAVRISRWERSLPQYRPGHLDLVDSIGQAVTADAAKVRLAGAAYRGLGIPACIRQGREAARSCLSD